MEKTPEDSCVSVVGIVVYNCECLFIKRTKEPLNWCPPCGSLRVGESITEGLKREIREETALDVDIVMPVTTWSGVHNSQDILSITFVCWAQSSDVKLSDEHEDFRWISLKKLSQASIHTDFDTTKWPHFVAVAKYFEELEEVK